MLKVLLSGALEIFAKVGVRWLLGPEPSGRWGRAGAVDFWRSCFAMELEKGFEGRARLEPRA